MLRLTLLQEHCPPESPARLAKEASATGSNLAGR